VAVNARLGAISTTFQGMLAKTIEEAPNRLRVAVHLWDAKTASILTGDFEAVLAADGINHTQVDYCFDITMRGRLMQAGQELVQPRLQEAIDQFVQCARTRIERPAEDVFRRAPLPLSERLNQAFQSLIEKIRQI
jgi:carbon monoxide dehydrogenase subunit G